MEERKINVEINVPAVKDVKTYIETLLSQGAFENAQENPKMLGEAIWKEVMAYMAQTVYIGFTEES